MYRETEKKQKNFYIPTCVGKKFKFIDFTILENALFRGNYPPSSYYYVLGRGKLLIPPGSILLKNCFPQQQKGAGGNYDLFYQNSVRKYEDDLEH